tara:strand:+ start:490 stop:678 length:189 start_codon:yes stop_codon:yes gene_type:complete
VDLFFQSWPVVTSVVACVIAGSLWAAKVYFMLHMILSKLDTVEKNISTHRHDDGGAVLIPAR